MRRQSPFPYNVAGMSVGRRCVFLIALLFACARDGSYKKEDLPHDMQQFDAQAEELEIDALLLEPADLYSWESEAEVGSDDTVSFQDVSPEENGAGSDEASRDIQTKCEAGYAVINGEGVYIAQCDRIGLSNLPLERPASQGEFVKIEGLVRVTRPSCSINPCPKDQPCCQRCYAQLRVSNVVLKGEGVAFGCQGTNCDYEKHCTPIKPDSSYILWGRLYWGKERLELIVNGYCLSP